MASAYARLKASLGITESAVRVVDPYQMLAEVEASVKKALGVDTFGIPAIRISKPRLGRHPDAGRRLQEEEDDAERLVSSFPRDDRGLLYTHISYRDSRRELEQSHH